MSERAAIEVLGARVNVRMRQVTGVQRHEMSIGTQIRLRIGHGRPRPLTVNVNALSGPATSATAAAAR